MANSEINPAGALAQAETARACHYAVLARLFDDQTTGADIERYLEYLQPFTGLPADPAAHFSEQLRHWLDREGLDHHLKTEYARLFIMPGGVRPYESVYRGESPLLMQDPWLEARRYYRRCGLQLENPARHPDDHAAVELAFMAYLAEAGGMQAEQATFFRQHLDRWLPPMLEEITQHQQARFFKDVAAYGRSFLDSERLYFGPDTKEAHDSPEQSQGSEHRR